MMSALGNGPHTPGTRQRPRRRRTPVARTRRSQTHVAQKDVRCVDGARGPRARARRLPHTQVH